MRSIIYARYSSHSQRDASIEDQARACQEAAEREGDEVVSVYFDRAASGTSDKRPAFQAMVADAASSDWERVWVYKTDRFARNRYDSAIYRRALKEAGVELKTAAEPIPEGPLGTVVEALMEGLAEYYSENLAENVRRGQRGNALKCHPNGEVRYGWDLCGDRYAVNESEAGAVREMYRLRAKGASYARIAERLNSLGHRNKYGSPITDRAVSGVVRNDAYRGVYRYGDVEVEGGIPRIVGDGEWEAAQRAVAPRRRRRVSVGPGMVFGKLEVLGQEATRGHHTRWLCACHACGGLKVEWATRLVSGRAADCGCRSPDGRERDELGRYA